MPYFENLGRLVAATNSHVCVGLDTDLAKIPESLKLSVLKRHGLSLPETTAADLQAAVSQDGQVTSDIILGFNRAIIKVTHPVVPVYKSNYWFYAVRGGAGMTALRMTVRYIHEVGRLAILDFKAGDIDVSSAQAASLAFNDIGADAVTVSPYLGCQKGLDEFLKRLDKGVYVLCVTSNLGGRELQDLQVSHRTECDNLWDSGEPKLGIPLVPLFKAVADIATRKPEWDAERKNMIRVGWNENDNVGLVTGATKPADIGALREYLREVVQVQPDRRWKRRPVHLLIPGFGKQEGDVDNSVQCASEGNEEGTEVYNLSRQIIYASSGEDFAEAAYAQAVAWRDRINACIPQPAVPAEVAP